MSSKADPIPVPVVREEAVDDGIQHLQEQAGSLFEPSIGRDWLRAHVGDLDEQRIFMEAMRREAETQSMMRLNAQARFIRFQGRRVPRVHTSQALAPSKMDRIGLGVVYRWLQQFTNASEAVERHRWGVPQRGGLNVQKEQAMMLATAVDCFLRSGRPVASWTVDDHDGVEILVRRIEVLKEVDAAIYEKGAQGVKAWQSATMDSRMIKGVTEVMAGPQTLRSRGALSGSQQARLLELQDE
jgi:hypothetical protein